jgi:N-acetylmuramoyl-L-alanine amidase
LLQFSWKTFFKELPEMRRIISNKILVAKPTGETRKTVRKKWLLYLLVIAGVAGFSVGANASSAITPYVISEVKLFVLQERQVMAVALDDRAPGSGIDDVLGYRLNPSYDEKRAAGRVELVVANAVLALKDLPADFPILMESMAGNQVKLTYQAIDAAKLEITTVRRKTVKARDGMIRMRTYLVFTIPRGTKKDIPTVVLDAGHGGPDTGAVKNFILEKDINLDITLRTARIFESKGWNVVLTRRTDVEPSLLERADAANIVDATVFISVHNNSLPEEKLPRSREFGTTVLYNAAARQPAEDLARMIQDELVLSTGTQREVLQDRPKLVVLNSTWVPAVLTEGVMMPNPANAKLILDRIQRQRTAEAIVRATETWYGKKVLAAKPTTQQAPQPLVKLESAPPGGGNMAGNAANRGTVAEQDGWIYYLRKADTLTGEKEETIWRFRPDRLLSDQLVADQEAWDLNIAPEGLYYANWSDNHTLHLVALDDRSSKRLTDGPVQQLSLTSDRIVFVRNRQIYSMARSGGMAVQVNEDEAENVVAWGDWIYYANGSDGFKPYRVRIDGTGRMKISNDETLFMVVAGEWIFYSNLSDGEKLYRVKIDGTNRNKIGDDRVGYLNFDQRYLYYTNTSQQNAVFRIMPDGSGRSKMVDSGKSAGPIGIAGSKLYYQGLFYDIK